MDFCGRRIARVRWPMAGRQIMVNHGSIAGQETAIMNILVYCIMHRWRVIRHPALLLRLARVYTLRFARVDAHPARTDASNIETGLWKQCAFDTVTTSLSPFFRSYHPLLRTRPVKIATVCHALRPLFAATPLVSLTKLSSLAQIAGSRFAKAAKH